LLAASECCRSRSARGEGAGQLGKRRSQMN
jgi:hypothetical protein